MNIAVKILSGVDKVISLIIFSFVVQIDATASPLPTPEEILAQERPTGWPEWVDVSMDRTVFKKEEHRFFFAESFKKAPSVFIETSTENLFGPEGLYLRKDTREESPEVPATVTYHHPTQKGFTIRCAVLPQGSGSRTQSEKRNFRLKFAQRFGASSLKFPLFSPEKTEEFENLLLRSPTHDSWTIKWPGWRVAPRYVNDRWAIETSLELGHLAPRQRWTHLFINQIYWGIYALSERPDEHFAAQHLGLKKDDLDLFNADQLRHGSLNQRERAEHFLKEELTNTVEGYKALEEMVDLPALIDHLICQIYQGKVDWPRRNYFSVIRHGTKPQLYFGPWDSETGFYHKKIASGILDQNALEFSPMETHTILIDDHGPGLWLKYLTQSEEFRLQFADRLHALTSAEGALSPKEASSRYRHLLNEVTPLLFAESARWGNACRKEPYLPYGGEWDTITAPDSWLFSLFFPNRAEALKEHFREHKFWPNLDPPQATLDKKGRVWLSNPNPRGIIVFTVDGTDPRAKWSSKPRGKAFREPIKIMKGTTVRARILSNQKWSAVTVSTFN